MSAPAPTAAKHVDATHSKPIVADVAGSKAGNWDEMGYDQVAPQDYVEQFFKGHVGPVAIGLVRMWESANAKQRESAEYRETFDSANADIFGEVPKVFK